MTYEGAWLAMRLGLKVTHNKWKKSGLHIYLVNGLPVKHWEGDTEYEKCHTRMPFQHFVDGWSLYKPEDKS